MAEWMRHMLAVDATAVRDLGLREAEDLTIFWRARAAGVVVLTKDSDFVVLLERHGPPPQVVWLRCGNTSNAALRGILMSAWPATAAALVAGEPLVELRNPAG